MLRKTIILCLLLAILAPIFLLTQLVDSQPLVQQSRTPDIVDAQKTKFLLKRSWEVLKQNRRAELAVKVDDLNAAVAFVSRGASFLSGHFSLEQQKLTGNLSIKIPKTPLGEYINFSAQVLPSDAGLEVESCRIGRLKIPGAFALLLVQKSIDLLADEQLGSQLLETIEKVSFSQDRLFVTFSSGTHFGTLKNRLLARVKEFKTNQDSDLELEQIQFYLQHLEATNQFRAGEPISLARILAPLFQQAEQRSLTTSAVDENRAALYALAIYLGGQDFRKLAKYLLSPEESFSRNRRVRYVLAERRDLVKHFLVSAGLKLMSDSQMGFAVGEFKELLDANEGGSGFSFIDLAADRSGVRFAESATESQQSAARFQQLISAITQEDAFFPKFRDLEEGLNQRNFIDRYGNVDSQRYREIVELIDQRLSRLPLYQ